ncbi:hypothetical protein BG262_07995 [Floricoccus penangensis]|uniref:Polysaccharide biosynthesis protein C-terminal domain-containing protein n=1 Tax=Floricoccus penangensis TaxID=1859475 RepID=A0A9Q5P1F2_9LACT|nr:flippase [Floricoccus penangensis]OFI47924.1 hypothetical protein BG262_07995 [Floricoccus penangensis]
MKLIKNIIYNTGYQVLSLIFPLITIPYVSRIFGIDGMGSAAYTNTVVSYFSLFAALSSVLYGNREVAYNQDNKENRSIVFWEIFFIKAITTTISVISFLFLVIFVIKEDYVLYFMQSFILLAVGLDISWYFMGVEEFKNIILRNMLIKILAVIVTFTFVKSPNDLWIYVGTVPISTFLGNLSMWPFMKNEVNLVRFKDLNLKRHIKPMLQLFLPQILIQFYLYLNKLMLGNMDSKAAAGIFDQSDRFIRVAVTLVTSLSAAVIPRIAYLHSTHQEEEISNIMYRSFRMVNAISIFSMFSIMAVSESFAVYFLGSEFKEVGIVMFIQSIMIVFVAWANVLGNQYLLPTNMIKEFNIGAFIGLIVNVVMNLILIPKLGVVGATITTVLTEVAVTLYQMFVLRKRFNIATFLFETWKYLLAGILVFFVTNWIDRSTPSSMFFYIIEACVAVVTYIVALKLLRSTILDELFALVKGVVKKNE